jgi:hypothetical protein
MKANEKISGMAAVFVEDIDKIPKKVPTPGKFPTYPMKLLSYPITSLQPLGITSAHYTMP